MLDREAAKKASLSIAGLLLTGAVVLGAVGLIVQVLADEAWWGWVIVAAILAAGMWALEYRATVGRKRAGHDRRA